MKKYISIIILISLFVVSCERAGHKEMAAEVVENAPVLESGEATYETIDLKDESVETEEEPEIPVEQVISSTAATYSDNQRKLIRTADLRFQVKDVYRSTVNIENVVAQYKGFITNSELNTNTYLVKSIERNDSILEINAFERYNQITFRVPSEKLHETLLGIAGEIDYLNYRIIQATDVSVDLLAQQLSQKRNKNTANKLSNLANQKGKTSDKVDALRTAHNYQSEHDQQLIQKLKMKDKIEFSSVTLYLQGNKSYQKKTHLNPAILIQAEAPGMGERLAKASTYGWHIFQDFIVFLTHLWPFILLLIAGISWWVFRKRKTKQKVS